MRISRKCLAALLAACVELASVAVADRIPAPDPGPSGWLESFDALDVNRWHATPRSQPPFWLGRGLSGRWDEANVAVTGGDLVLTAVVRDGYAEAAELQSRERLHYGTYEMAVMAEPIEGMIAGVFSYTPDSETEIDFEFEGRDPGVLHAVTWRTVHTKEHTAHTSGQPMSGRWLRLRYDWSSTGISFYVNGALVAEHRRIVPERPAYLMFNVWPTNDPAWGGVSTNGTGRMWVDWVRFTPEGGGDRGVSPP